MRIKSIKHQTLIMLVGLTLGVSCVFSLLAVITAFVVEDSVISNFIDQQALQMENHYAVHGTIPNLPNSSVKVFNGLAELPFWAKQHIKPGKIRGEIFTPDATHYHYRELNLGGEKPAYLLAEVSGLLAVTQQPRLSLFFLAAFLIATLIAFFIAIKFSQSIVEPILTLTDAVKLNEKSTNILSLPTLRNELGYLSRTLQRSFEKLNEALEREKAFSTNVSHELRTPLTVLKNSCLLMSQRGFRVEDLSQLKHSCEQMENTVSVLLSLARSEFIPTQACNVVMQIERAILRCQNLVPEVFHIKVSVPDDLTVRANDGIVSLLLINLFRNAVEHASEPGVTIEYEDGKLIFENKAEGVPNSDITQPGTKSETSEGLGQGLYLVARIAERLGWTLSIASLQQRFRIIVELT